MLILLSYILPSLILYVYEDKTFNIDYNFF